MASVVTKDIANDDLALLLEKKGIRLRQGASHNTLATWYGALKRGIDGMEYQQAIRNEDGY